MNKIGYKVVLATIATAAVLATSGCSGVLSGGGSDPTNDTGPIMLADIVPISGSLAPSGLTMKNGAQMAVDEINAKGGVLNRKLKLDVLDGACDPQQAVSAANKAISNGDVMSVGNYCSGAALPTLPIFNKAHIPMILAAADSQVLPDAKSPNAFLINGTGVQQAESAVKFMKKEGVKSVALVDDNTQFSKDITTGTAKDLEKDGSVKVLLNTSITAGESDYSSIVHSIVSANPDMLYFTAYYQEGGLIINQLRAAGFTGKIMVGDGSVDPALIKIAGVANAEGVFATSPPTPDTLPNAKNWVANYTKKFNIAPGPFSTQAYDAVRLAAQVITNAKTTDGPAVIKALKTIKGFQLFTGTLEFTPEQTLKSGGYVILVVKDGEFTLKDSLK
ncbi:MAG: branched-chain amino acid ABC transporter substrate-binding protein [Microbacteriaceae bacterium]